MSKIYELSSKEHQVELLNAIKHRLVKEQEYEAAVKIREVVEVITKEKSNYESNVVYKLTEPGLNVDMSEVDK